MARHDNGSIPIHIGTDRQLFVDDFWIVDAKDVTRHLHEPVRREVVISLNIRGNGAVFPTW